MEGRSGEDHGDPCWETEARVTEGSEIGGSAELPMKDSFKLTLRNVKLEVSNDKYLLNTSCGPSTAFGVNNTIVPKVHKR